MNYDGVGVGTRVGKYILKRRIGAGAMGEVFEAEHEITAEHVAVKILTKDVNESGLWLERFHREARAASKIGHPAIAQVHDAGFDGAIGRYYLAMEFLQGETFSSRAASGRMSLSSGLLLLCELLDALDAAHQASIIHRDVKPDNIFIETFADGFEQVKLLDFGIAKEQDKPSATRADASIGTPYYMSPEQARASATISSLSDIWSVGVILYWLVEGHPPFTGESSYDIVLKACAVDHEPLRNESGAPEKLIELINACLQKEPGKRPQDARLLRDELETILSHPTDRANLDSISVRLHQSFSPERALPAPTTELQMSANAPPTQPRIASKRILSAASSPPAPTSSPSVSDDWYPPMVGRFSTQQKALFAAAGLVGFAVVLGYLLGNATYEVQPLEVAEPKTIQVRKSRIVAEPEVMVKPALVAPAAKPAKVEPSVKKAAPKALSARRKPTAKPKRPAPLENVKTNSPKPELAKSNLESATENEPTALAKATPDEPTLDSEPKLKPAPVEVPSDSTSSEKVVEPVPEVDKALATSVTKTAREARSPEPQKQPPKKAASPAEEFFSF